MKRGFQRGLEGLHRCRGRGKLLPATHALPPALTCYPPPCTEGAKGTASQLAVLQ